MNPPVSYWLFYRSRNWLKPKPKPIVMIGMIGRGRAAVAMAAAIAAAVAAVVAAVVVAAVVVGVDEIDCPARPSVSPS